MSSHERFRVAFVADNQADERRRMEEHNRVMAEQASLAQAAGVGLTIHGGDVYERKSTVIERESVMGWADAVTLYSDLVVAGGNHEWKGEVEEIGRRAQYPDRVWAFETPQVVELDDAVVAVLPWPRKGALLATLDRPIGPEATSAAVREALALILGGFRERFEAADPAKPRILAAHVSVIGSRAGPDQPALVGTDIEVTIEDLMLAKADVILLGHIHRPQEWFGPPNRFGDRTPIIYAGSPRRTAYSKGEQEPKGFVMLDFVDGRLAEWARVPLSATPLLLGESEWRDGAMNFTFDAGDIEGAEIRLRYSVPTDEREAAMREAERLAAELRERGAREVVIDEMPVVVHSARAPEVAQARGIGDKLRGLWDARREVPDEGDRERLVRRAEELESDMKDGVSP